jgi:hypothetical protein
MGLLNPLLKIPWGEELVLEGLPDCSFTRNVGRTRGTCELRAQNIPSRSAFRLPMKMGKAQHWWRLTSGEGIRRSVILPVAQAEIWPLLLPVSDACACGRQ